MKEYEKWIRQQDQLPAFPRYGTIEEDCAASDGWRAALGWVLDNFDGKTDFLTLGLRVRDELGYE